MAAPSWMLSAQNARRSGRSIRLPLAVGSQGSTTRVEIAAIGAIALGSALAYQEIHDPAAASVLPAEPAMLDQVGIRAA
jgi:hypothetical protein